MKMSWSGEGSDKGYCANCGGVVYRTPKIAAQYKNRYCNDDCWMEHINSGYRCKVSDEEIMKAHQRCLEGMSLTKSAKKVGICGKALSKRFKKLNLT